MNEIGVCGQRDCVPAFSLSVSLQFQRNPTCILCSTSELPQMGCGHPGYFLLMRSRKVLQLFTVAKSKNTVQPVIVMEQSMKGFNYDAEWSVALAIKAFFSADVEFIEKSVPSDGDRMTSINSDETLGVRVWLSALPILVRN